MLSSRPLKSLVLSLALIAPVILGGCDRQSGDATQPGQQSQPTGTAPAKAGVIDRSHKGAPLPDFTVTDPAGKTLKLKELKGPVLINLWATWCVPCVVELPQLDQLAAERAGSLRVVTVSQDLEGGAKVAEFLKAKGIARLEPWLEPNGDLGMHFGGNLPTTVYYDAAGREVWRVAGEHDWTSAETAALLAEAG